MIPVGQILSRVATVPAIALFVNAVLRENVKLKQKVEVEKGIKEFNDRANDKFNEVERGVKAFELKALWYLVISTSLFVAAVFVSAFFSSEILIVFLIVIPTVIFSAFVFADLSAFMIDRGIKLFLKHFPYLWKFLTMSLHGRLSRQAISRSWNLTTERIVFDVIMSEKNKEEISNRIHSKINKLKSDFPKYVLYRLYGDSQKDLEYQLYSGGLDSIECENFARRIGWLTINICLLFALNFFWMVWRFSNLWNSILWVQFTVLFVICFLVFFLWHKRKSSND